MTIDRELLAGMLDVRMPPPDECRALRVNAGLSLREAAQVVGTTSNSMLRWEQGLARPRRDTAKDYLEFLDLLREHQR